MLNEQFKFSKTLLLPTIEMGRRAGGAERNEHETILEIITKIADESEFLACVSAAPPLRRSGRPGNCSRESRSSHCRAELNHLVIGMTSLGSLTTQFPQKPEEPSFSICQLEPLLLSSPLSPKRI